MSLMAPWVVALLLTLKLELRRWKRLSGSIGYSHLQGVGGASRFDSGQTFDEINEFVTW